MCLTKKLALLIIWLSIIGDLIALFIFTREYSQEVNNSQKGKQDKDQLDKQIKELTERLAKLEQFNRQDILND